jgi:hypothetical protein
VKEILAAGGYTTVNTLGSGFISPSGVSVDGSGNVFVGDEGHNAVKEIMAAGGYTTINTLGSGFSAASGTALDGSGKVFVADYGNNRVVELDYADSPSLSFASTAVGSTSTDSPRTVTVINDGNEDLALSAVSYPTDFREATGDANACTGTTSLSAGQQCDLPIEFGPENAGSPLSEDVTLTDNALNVSGAQQLVAVTGTATSNTIPSHFVVTTTASVVAGSPFTVTVTALLSNGNIATGYNGTVSFASSDPRFVNPGLLTLTSGVGQTTVTLNTVGTQSITATDTSNSTLTGYGSFSVAPAPPGPDTLYLPSPGSILNGPEVTFTWTPLTGATGYSLWIGTTGAGSKDLYDSGEYTTTWRKFAGLPTHGETIYVRLYTTSGKATVHSDYTYTATTQAAMISPSPDTSLGSSTVTFTWSAAAGATGYSLWLSSIGPGLDDLYDSHEWPRTSATVNGLPTNDATIYARLFTTYGNATVHSDYTYTAH